jgi:TnpA family transposase
VDFGLCGAIAALSIVCRPASNRSAFPGACALQFGAFWLLGYRFSPRLADLGDARLWRLDRAADYGVLTGLARNRIDRELIARNWDDLLRLAGSLKMSTVGAVELLHSLQGGGRVSTLGRA